MDSSRSRSGIQQLLTAEQEAQRIVNEARNAKMAGLRQAKEEAEKEIAAYHAQKEAEFQRKLAQLKSFTSQIDNTSILTMQHSLRNFLLLTKQSSGDSAANVKRLEQETEEKIQHLKSQAENISPDVIQMLLKQVIYVKY